MIRKRLYLRKYDWVVHTYFAVSNYYVDEIMRRLLQLDCDDNTAEKAYKNMSSEKLNNGLCYSNLKLKESVLVVAKTTSASEFANSLHHELVHLQSHIAKRYNLNPLGEEVAYLSGEIMLKLYPSVAHLLCDCCRKKGNNGKIRNVRYN